MNRRQFSATALATSIAPSTASAQSDRLDGPRRGAVRPPARFLIVLLHGYGSDGNDLFSLASAIAAFAPNAAICAPNAPVAMPGGGYSWQTDAERGNPAHLAIQSSVTLNRFPDAELALTGVNPDHLILFGFSQGAATALNIGLRRAVTPAAIIAFAGPRLDPEGLTPRGSTPRVLLAHGDQDDRVKPQESAATLKTLELLGIKAESHLMSGLGHNIDDREMRLAGKLLQAVTRF